MSTIFAFTLALLLSIGSCCSADTSSVSACAEDVVLIGVGDFENGRWSHYQCGPALDDYLYYNGTP